MCNCAKKNLTFNLGVGVIIFTAGYFLGRKDEYNKIIRVVAIEIFKDKQKTKEKEKENVTD